MSPIKKLTFEQACEKTGYNPANCLPFANPKNKDEEAYNALNRLEIYIEAYNMEMDKKWVADYANSEQPKWRAWFRYDTSSCAFRFLFSTYDYTIAYAATGSRHSARTSDIAEHVGKAHIDDWNKWLLK
jgi:hypothetical protein